jgi:hypothetical protein
LDNLALAGAVLFSLLLYHHYFLRTTALQTALLESTAQDNSLTLLEVIQHYPTDEIHLDVERAIQTYNHLAEYQKPFQKALETIESVRQILEN